MGWARGSRAGLVDTDSYYNVAECLLPAAEEAEDKNAARKNLCHIQAQGREGRCCVHVLNEVVLTFNTFCQ